MRIRGFRVGLPRVSLPGRAVGRWIVVGVGLAVLGVALVGAADPYRQIREFRGVVACERDAGDCFDGEAGSVVGRRTYTTTTTHTDANGGTYTDTTTHYEVTWQRADGSRQARNVSSGFYDKAEKGKPVTLRLWHGEVVGVEVAGGSQWFLPKSGGTLNTRLYVAHFGLGLLLWGLLLGWWDGFFMLVFRTFTWMFMSFVPVGVVTDALAYGPATGGELVTDVLLVLLFSGIAGAMLIGSLGDR